ncbi:MAG: bifunctional glutamate N-acetyltransferase/amino-acid acetyltransferase ArgJ [Caldilineales bacterium]|nr:bifunctional glutamate N-acetyltransferase/amino-acid acetyltransferase ArgJ [Caldilineales bacterium]
MTTFLPFGFRHGGMHCGIKKNGDPDLALVLSDRPCTAAALFTQNRFAAAPVVYDKEVLARNANAVRAVLINSGNANAVTGEAGLANTRRNAEALEAALGLESRSVLIMSTGVIGVPLPVERIETAIPVLAQAAQADADGFHAAARAIMTTDTRPKSASLKAQIDGREIRLAGIAKGAGMIHPNMATMLSVIITDATVPPELLRLALRRAADRSFNRISVDGDTSTNDTVILLANGAAQTPTIEETSSPAFEQFVDALTTVAGILARAIVADGEGATKLVTIRVSGLPDDHQAHRIANAIAVSPLVKTAIYGGDANWGRILATAGNSGVVFEPNSAELWISSATEPEHFGERMQLVANGMPLAYDESAATAHFAHPELLIDLSLGSSPGQSEMWTCDLSHDYVTINGDYRT